MAPAERARLRQANVRDPAAAADAFVIDPRLVARPAFDPLRGAEFEDAVRLPERIQPHVAETAGAVIVPAAIETERVVRMVRSIRDGALPQGPVEAVGNGWA